VSAQDVALNIKTLMKKSQNIWPVWLRAKWFWPSKCAQFAEAGKRYEQSCAPAKEECNKFDLTDPACF
jgi:hypothetical protein